MAYLIWVLCMLGIISEDKVNDYNTQQIHEITYEHKAVIEQSEYQIGMAWDENDD